MPRVIRGLGALAVLLLGTVGVPLALVVLGGDPMPDRLTWPAVRDALLSPDDGTILLGLVTVIGWAAWAVFAGSVVSELVAVLSRQRIQIRLPGLAGPQRLAAGLLISAIAMTSAPQLVQAQVPPRAAVTAQPVATPAPARGKAAEPAAPGPLAGSEGKLANPGHRHVVRLGDDLWSLAETYYGHGRDWRKIAMANPTVLTGGPDRLVGGMTLIIPDPAHRSTPSDGPTVTVRRGDTLSALAERELGAADRWPELFHANRAQLNDPDDLVVGTQLRLPPATPVRDRRTAPGPTSRRGHTSIGIDRPSRIRRTVRSRPTRPGHRPRRGRAPRPRQPRPQCRRIVRSERRPAPSRTPPWSMPSCR